MNNQDNASRLFIKRPAVNNSYADRPAVKKDIIHLVSRNIKDISNEVLSNFEAWESLYLGFKNVSIKVMSNSRKLISELGLYYRGFCIQKTNDTNITIHAIEGATLDFGVKYLDKQPDPGKSRIKEQYFDLADGRIVKKKLTGMVFVFGCGLNIAAGECIKNSNQVVNFINNRYMEHMLNRGCLMFHSAAVGTHQKGAAISGFAGAGKSTLALKVLEKGFCFISNDRLLARKESIAVMIYGVPKLPRINPGTIVTSKVLRALIPEEEIDNYLKLELDKLWQIEKKYDVPIDSIFGKSRFIPEARLSGLFILNWKRNGGALDVQKVNLDKRCDLFSIFMKSPGLFYNPLPVNKRSIITERDYLTLLEGCEIFEFTGGIDFEQAAIFIEDFLNKA